MSSGRQIAASFRDPSGFVFERDGVLLRQVNRTFHAEYSAASALYAELAAEGLLVRHEVAPLSDALTDDAIAVLRPERVPFVSYPYEWCFSQLKDAALLTLEVHRRALLHGFGLRDASAYNVQWLRGRPVLIDTLSLAPLQEEKPWVAYRQFCQHFLAPLLLMMNTDVRLGTLLTRYLDGVPLDLASRLLPRRTWGKWGSLLHVHMHARSMAAHAQPERAADAKARRFSKTGHAALTDSLLRQVRAVDWTPSGTQWAEYEREHNYSDSALEAKKSLVSEALRGLRPATVWDLGANTGTFSRLAAESGALVLSIDSDPAAVERNYRHARSTSEQNLLPLLVDLSAPSPAIGWANVERESLQRRGTADLILALALVHHLAIAGNVPLPLISDYFASLGENLLIEFVPKADSQVRRLLSSRDDVFPEYTQSGFEKAFSYRWEVRSATPIQGSERTLYLMTKRDSQAR